MVAICPDRSANRGDQRRIFLSPRTDGIFEQMHAAESRLGGEILRGITLEQAEDLWNTLSRMKQNLLAPGIVSAEDVEQPAD
jgi:DNA-binding MarR family transcriptional regulator